MQIWISLCLSPCSFCPHHGLLEVIGFNAADEKGLAHGQRLHQGIQRLTELANQSRHSLLDIHVLLPDAHNIEIV